MSRDTKRATPSSPLLSPFAMEKGESYGRLPFATTQIQSPVKYGSKGRVFFWCFLVVVAWFLHVQVQSPWTDSRSGLPTTLLDEGLQQCRLDRLRPFVDTSLPKNRLEQLRSDEPTFTFKNATLINGNGHTYPESTVVIKGNLILKVCSGDDNRCTSESTADSTCHEVVDLSGRYLTPGLVDMHSHVGVREIPELWATEDVTETMHGPLSPWARAIDGLKTQDRAIKLLASGGITTSLVLTGAKNLISGEAAVIKMKDRYSPGDLLVTNHGLGSSPKPPRYLKMACGENIKAQYQSTTGGPNSREGMSFYVREAFYRARLLKQQQDLWCESASSPELQSKLSQPYPSDLEMQTLVDVLRGDVRVNVHCYEPQDVYSLYDHADEFKFNITALHHALEAHHVLDLIVSHGSMLATFSDEWGFKKEVFGASAYMLKSAAERNIPIALTSDHPAKHGQYLMYEAQIGNHFGLGEELSISSLTGVPAKALGLDNRLGHIKQGFDADMVVWDKHPLQLGARPLQVVLEGETIVNASEHGWIGSLGEPDFSKAPEPRLQLREDVSVCKEGQQDLVVRGIRQDYTSHAKNNLTEHNESSLVILKGRVVCIGGPECEDVAHVALRQGVPEMHIPEGHVLPGLTLVTRHHGLAEILSEESTSDGTSAGNDMQAIQFTKFGLQFDGAHLDRAYRAGITRLITPPQSHGMIHGVSAAFASGAHNRAIVNPKTALHFTIGNEAKTASFPTISSQIAQLHALLRPSPSSPTIYHRAANGTLPLVIHTGNKDTIAQLIALKHTHPAVNLVIMGGAESHTLAHQLAAAEIPVILAPWVCHPFTWEVRNCLPGPPLTDGTAASALLDAGVKVALGNWDARDRYVRNALWEASWVAGAGTGAAAGRERVALDLVSRNVEEIFGLESTQDLVVYSRSPFEFGASVALVFERGRVGGCWPDVE